MDSKKVENRLTSYRIFSRLRSSQRRPQGFYENDNFYKKRAARLGSPFLCQVFLIETEAIYRTYGCKVRKSNALKKPIFVLIAPN
jgi:hypothetical protein